MLFFVKSQNCCLISLAHSRFGKAPFLAGAREQLAAPPSPALSHRASTMSRKENALDLAKLVDKAIRVKLSGGREREFEFERGSVCPPGVAGNSLMHAPPHAHTNTTTPH